MKLGKWGRLGLPLFFIAGGACGAAVVAACSSDSTPATPPVDGGANNDASTVACVTPAAGAFPVATCGIADNKACPASPSAGCAINQATCGDPSTCMPTSNNTGKSQLDFRMRRINVQAPTALAATFVQSAVVTKNVDLPATQGCGDSGFGAFNWLIRVDKTANTLTTGGAPPSSDPFGVGYCFYNDVAPPEKKTLVSPVTVALVKNADGSYGGAAAPLLNIPIFLNGQSENVVILPISDATFHSFTTSDSDNCVGSFNRNALDSTCTDDSTTCEKWKTAGSLGGYITIEAADTVNVADLNESLCVLITQTTKDPTTNKCKRVDGKIPNTGDYCSTTKSPGGCADSYWMAATFAAAAVKIDESGSVATCKAFDGGAPPPVDSGTEDAGTDTGTADTGTDAGAQDAASE